MILKSYHRWTQHLNRGATGTITLQRFEHQKPSILGWTFWACLTHTHKGWSSLVKMEILSRWIQKSGSIIDFKKWFSHQQWGFKIGTRISNHDCYLSHPDLDILIRLWMWNRQATSFSAKCCLAGCQQVIGKFVFSANAYINQNLRFTGLPFGKWPINLVGNFIPSETY